MTVGSMFGQRRGRWANIEPTLGERWLSDQVTGQINTSAFFAIGRQIQPEV